MWRSLFYHINSCGIASPKTITAEKLSFWSNTTLNGFEPRDEDYSFTDGFMEDKDFKVIEREVTGEVYIKANTQFNNINATFVTVGENVTARLYGIIKKKLVLKKGSVLHMHGYILGTIENEGGTIQIYGKN